MTDSRTTFHIEATIRFADGSTIMHSEAHDERGVIYSHEFACAQAEAAAAELGGTVEDVESFTYTPGGVDWSALDLY